MTYSAAVSYLYRLQKHGIKLGLETMQSLADRLGHPERAYKTLHIAGTNGKGSTAAMAAAILKAAGVRVGLYTSPHLVDFRERMQVDGTMISESDTARLTEQVKRCCGTDLIPTFFEATTAMALQYFDDVKVDVAVLEVGLGGRFDATNIVTPISTAITTIALDHQEYLGDNLASIAFEKAGIVKPGVPVVIGAIEGEARRRIEAIAVERAAPLTRWGEEFHAEGSNDGFLYRSGAHRYARLDCALIGAHQVRNAACAIALLEAAAPSGISVSEAAVREGLRTVRWDGRLEVVGRNPLILLDGAHNEAGAQALASYLRGVRLSRPGSRIVLVLGMMRDKDHHGFAAALSGLVDHVVFTQADLPRSVPAQDLHRSLQGLFPSAVFASAPGEALASARQWASGDDVIGVTGSLMLVGEVKALVRGCGLSPLRG